MIYLIHMPVRAVLNRYKFSTILFDYLAQNVDGILLECIYTVGMVFFVFAISLALSVIISGVSFGVKGIRKTVKNI